MCLNGKAADVRGTNTVLFSFQGKTEKLRATEIKHLKFEPKKLKKSRS